MSNLSKTSASILITDGAAGADLLPKALPPQSSSCQVKRDEYTDHAKNTSAPLKVEKGRAGRAAQIPVVR